MFDDGLDSKLFDLSDSDEASGFGVIYHRSQTITHLVIGDLYSHDLTKTLTELIKTLDDSATYTFMGWIPNLVYLAAVEPSSICISDFIREQVNHIVEGWTKQSNQFIFELLAADDPDHQAVHQQVATVSENSQADCQSLLVIRMMRWGTDQKQKQSFPSSLTSILPREHQNDQLLADSSARLGQNVGPHIDPYNWVNLFPVTYWEGYILLEEGDIAEDRLRSELEALNLALDQAPADSRPTSFLFIFRQADESSLPYDLQERIEQYLNSVGGIIFDFLRVFDDEYRQLRYFERQIGIFADPTKDLILQILVPDN